MAEQLVASLAAPFEPERYPDVHREQVLALVERKAAGEVIEPPAEDARGRAGGEPRRRALGEPRGGAAAERRARRGDRVGPARGRAPARRRVGGPHRPAAGQEEAGVSARKGVEVEVEGRRILLRNLDKVFYPEAGFTKGDVVDYYVRIAPVLLPHLRDRPLTLKRYPEGVEGQFFYEKRCPRYRPAWLRTAPIWSEGNQEDIRYCVVDDLASLVWVATIADLELHTPARARGRLRAADDARLRSRSRAARRRRRLLRGRAPPPAAHGAARARVLREDLRLEGAPGLRPARRPRRRYDDDEGVRARGRAPPRASATRRSSSSGC